MPRLWRSLVSTICRRFVIDLIKLLAVNQIIAEKFPSTSLSPQIRKFVRKSERLVTLLRLSVRNARRLQRAADGQDAALTQILFDAFKMKRPSLRSFRTKPPETARCPFMRRDTSVAANILERALRIVDFRFIFPRNSFPNYSGDYVTQGNCFDVSAFPCATVIRLAQKQVNKRSFIFLYYYDYTQ